MLDEEETATLAKNVLADDNAAVLMATSGARGNMDNLAMMAGSIGQPRFVVSALSVDIKTVSCRTSVVMLAVQKRRASYLHLSSVALNLQNSSCYLYLEENLWSIPLSELRSPDTCNVG